MDFKIPLSAIQDENNDSDTEATSLYDIFKEACFLRFWKMRDFTKDLFSFYLPSPLFALADAVLLLKYFFSSPYRLLRLYNKAHLEKSLGPYGETPYTTLQAIWKRCRIPKSWTVIDIGSGRGRALLWMHYIAQQRYVIGVDQFPLFVSKFLQIKTRFKLQSIDCFSADAAHFLKAILDTEKCRAEHTVVFLYASAMTDSECRRLGAILSQFPRLHIISTSFSFFEYDYPKIKVQDVFSTDFPWGSAEVYFQQVQ